MTANYAVELLRLNDSYLDGEMTRTDWAIRLNELETRAASAGIDLFDSEVK